MEQTYADEYAEVIANEVRELEAALAALLEAGADAADFDGVTFTDAMDVMHHYVTYLALSVEDVTARTYGEDAYEARRSVEVLRTYGGPGAWIDFRGNGYAVVYAVSGRDRARVEVYAPLADTELWEWMDAFAYVDRIGK